jgi:hypothetical protein
MFRDLFRDLDVHVARILPNALVRFYLYISRLRGWVFSLLYLGVLDIFVGHLAPRPFGFAQSLVMAIFSSIFILVFLAGAGGLLKDTPYSATVKASSSDAAELFDKIRAELDQLRDSEVPDLIRERLKQATEEITKQLEGKQHQEIDLSDPDKIFHASRLRLMEESIRIDRISRRNLYFGIVFSAFALGSLAWPLLV